VKQRDGALVDGSCMPRSKVNGERATTSLAMGFLPPGNTKRPAGGPRARSCAVAVGKQRFLSPPSALPTSSLERMSVDDNYQTLPWAHFKVSFSSIILCCGPSFTEYDSLVPLSDAALDHLIHLPRLRTWRIHGPPPSYPTSSLPLVFPPLKELTLGEGAA